MGFFTNILASIGSISASTGTQGCYVLIVDEPRMPNRMINR